jgi:hypothetical protein
MGWFVLALVIVYLIGVRVVARRYFVRRHGVSLERGEPGGLRAAWVGGAWPITMWLPSIKQPPRCNHRRHLLHHAQMLNELEALDRIRARSKPSTPSTPQPSSKQQQVTPVGVPARHTDPSTLPQALNGEPPGFVLPESSAPPGWYPDPASSEGWHRRWWDGQDWTERTDPEAIQSRATVGGAPAVQADLTSLPPPSAR